AVADERLGDRLRWEPSRGGQLFPHLYGPLDPAEAASVRPLPLGPDGAHLFPPLDESRVRRPMRFREIVWRIGRVALLFAAIYAGLCYIFWQYEPAFVFSRVERAGIAPAQAGATGFAEVQVPTEDGLKLYGWWRPPPPGHGAILVFTGTGVSLIDYGGL